MPWSITIPRIGAIHFEGLFKMTGRSRFCSGRNIVHYEDKRLTGKTTLNPLGQPNHYTCEGIPVGYSRKVRRTKIVHYNRHGRPIGYSRCLGLIWFHRGRILKEGWMSQQKCVELMYLNDRLR